MPGLSDTNSNTNPNNQSSTSFPNSDPVMFNCFLIRMNNQNPNSFFMNPN